MSTRIEFYLQTPSPGWQVIVPSEAGIVPGAIVETHLQQYSWSFKHKTLYDAQTYPFMTPVRITDIDADLVEQVMFRGWIATSPRRGSVADEGIQYQCEGFWSAVGRVTLKLDGVPFVVYNARSDDPQYDPDRQLMTVREIIEDMNDLCEAACSAEVLALMKVVWPGITVEDDLDIKPAKITFNAALINQSLAQLLTFAPDAFLEIDRDTGAFTIRRKGSATSHNLTLDSFGDVDDSITVIEEIQMVPRVDNVIPRLKLHYPVRNEYLEGYIDPDLVLGTPGYQTGVNQDIVALDDFRFQLSHYPLSQAPEIVGGGQYKVSLVKGIVTFKAHPSDFTARYFAQDSLTVYDTGYGGTGYDVWGVTSPIVERYMFDFPITTRAFYLLGVDPEAGSWLLSIDFAQAFSDSDLWPNLIGKAVTIPDRTASTIAEIAVHEFVFTGEEAIAIGSIIGVANSGALSLNCVGIRTAAEISGAVRGDQLGVTVEDATASVSALADAVWKYSRDVRWAGDIPTLRWMRSLKIGQGVNLLGTNEPKMATMSESIVSLSFDLVNERTIIRLAANPYTAFDDLLSIVRQAFPNESYLNSSTGSGGDGGGAKADLKAHKHANSSDGGDELKPDSIAMGGASAPSDTIAVGANGVVINVTKIVIGNPTGQRTEISAGVISLVCADTKVIDIGNSSGVPQLRLDGIEYMFTASGTRYMGAKTRSGL